MALRRRRWTGERPGAAGRRRAGRAGACDGHLPASLGTTNYRTTLYVREGSCLGPDLACNQRGCGEHSRITLPVVAGTTYFIVVDGFLADAGNFTLTVN